MLAFSAVSSGVLILLPTLRVESNRPAARRHAASEIPFPAVSPVLHSSWNELHTGGNVKWRKQKVLYELQENGLPDCTVKLCCLRRCSR